MQAELTRRQTYVISLSDIGQQDSIIHPELITLKLDHRRSPLDVGVLAFSTREKAKGGYLVDVKSLVPSRRNALISLLDRYYVEGSSHKTIETELKSLESGLDWCDKNGIPDVLCNAESARLGYVGFSNHLFQAILGPDRMSPHTGQLYQRSLRRAIDLQFPLEAGYILTAVPSVVPDQEGLDPPDERAVQRYVDIALVIAFTFSRFLIDGAPYPLKFETSDYHTHIFPGTGKYITPLTEGRHEFMAYDYKDGRIKSLNELMLSHPGKRPRDYNNALHSAIRAVDDANSDDYHLFRMRLASVAMRAYACLLNSVIGANSGELIQFLYDDAVEIVKSPLKNELSAIKLRAKGLEVNYSVGRGPGMEILREYLKFRDWVLQGRESEYLFFQAIDSEENSDSPKPLEIGFSTMFYTVLDGVFLPKGTGNIPPRLMRKHKSLTLHQLRHSPLLVSAVMNHSERTNAAYYTGTTLSNQKEELGNYWAAIKKAAERIKSTGKTAGVSIAVGHCEAIDNPQKDIPIVSIEPDCKTQYGCLFCVHYLAHSDETDIHKLLSFLYVIEAVRSNAPNFEFSEQIFKDVVIRIESFLGAISERSVESADLVVTMRTKVFDLGILTVFWERRLQRYEKMGIYF